MSDTPRTDAARLSVEERRRFANMQGVMYELVAAKDMRDLERELAAAHKALMVCDGAGGATISSSRRDWL